MKVRPLVLPFIRYVIGDGSSTYLWWDSWLPCGPLYLHFPSSTIHEFGSYSKAKVSSILHNGNWIWPVSWQYTHDVRRFIHCIASYSLSSLVEDCVIWILSPSGTYTLTSAILYSTPSSFQVPWANLVWFKNRIPRFAFICWLACKHKLTTRDVLTSWGVQVPLYCPFCLNSPESMEHLFFNCSFTKPIWLKLISFFRLSNPSNDLHLIILWLSNLTTKQGFKSELLTLRFSTSIYLVWRVRNDSIFNARNTNLLALTHEIVNAIRMNTYIWKNIPRTQSKLLLILEMGLNINILKN